MDRFKTERWIIVLKRFSRLRVKGLQKSSVKIYRKGKQKKKENRNNLLIL